MIFELLTKHKSKIFITCLLLILICGVSAGFASDDGDSLAAGDADGNVSLSESPIDEVVSVEEVNEQSNEDDGLELLSSENYTEDSDVLSAEDNSQDVLAAPGTYSQLESKISSSHYITLDNDYARSSYSGIMDISHALVIDGNGHYIDNQDSTSAVFRVHTHEKVVFRNVTFQNFGSTVITAKFPRDAILEFENCKFLNTGSGITLTYDRFMTLQLRMTNVEFIANSNPKYYALLANPAVVGNFNNVTIKGYKSTTNYAGGMAFVQGFTGNFTNVNFIDNTGGVAGAISFESSVNANFTNVKFINNTGTKSGTNTPASTGAIYFKVDANAMFENVEFTGNKETYANYNTNSAGAIYASKGLNAEFRNVNFTNNSAYNGGAIHTAYFNGTFEDVNFIGNNASSSGGAIYAEYFAGNYNTKASYFNATLKNVNFINNYAGSSGGGAYISSGNVLFDHVKFTKNSAYTTGGGLYFSNGYNSTFADVEYVGNKIIRNTLSSGYSGGAAVILTLSRNSVKLIRNSFYNNSASYYGGAVSISSEGSAFENCTFVNNTINQYGGAVYASSKCNFTDCTFVKNTASKHGGAVYLTADCDFANCDFFNNTALLGSAIGIYYSYSNVNINQSRFINNTGGPVAATNGYTSRGHLCIWDSTFDRNTGDAITARFSLNVTNSNITNNVGRAIYVYGDTYYATAAYLNRIVCINNTADCGSAIYSRTTQMNITDSTFLNNTAKSVSLEVNYEKFKRQIEVSYTVGNNYINAIDSNYDVNFKNVTYFDYYGILNSDDVYPVKTYNAVHATVLAEVYIGEDELLTSFNMSTDDNGMIVYPYDYPVLHHIVCTHFDDPYYDYISGRYDYTWGDFDELQLLILKTEGDVLDLPRNFTYIIGLDTITEGIFINKTFTINGNGYTINALNQSRIFRLEADGITLNDIRFANAIGWNGSSVYGVNVTDTKINNCIFDNYGFMPVESVEWDGGAIYIIGNDTSISNSKFANLAALTGGAVYLDGFNASVSNSEFENCHAVMGGAAYVNASKSEIANSTFVNCNASYVGGAVCWDGDDGIIRGSTFRNNLIEKSNPTDFIYVVNGGGAVLWAGNNGLITESNFTENSAVIRNDMSDFNDIMYGGAVLVFGLNTNVSNSYFSQNYAQSGGAVAIRVSSNMPVNPRYFKDDFNVEEMEGFGSNIVNSTFTDNFAQYGGAVLLGSCQNAVVESKFYNNTAYLAGAVIFEGMNSVIDSSLFENNVAHLGGAVCSGYNRTYYEIGGYEEVYDDEIGWYEVPFYVPVVRFVGFNNTIQSSQFINNSADSAGAVLVLEKSDVIKSTLFRYNHLADSYDRYSAKYLKCYEEDISHDEYIGIQDNFYSGVNGLVYGLEPRDYGGAVYWFGADGSIIDDEFVENSALKGGALFQEISSVLVDSSRFVKNNATYGGAVWMNNNSFIVNSNMSENSATYGGAIYWMGSNGELTGVLLLDNRAQFGGGIYVRGEFNSILSSNLTLNKADYGSAIYLDARGLAITSTSLLENQAMSTSLFVNLSTGPGELAADVILEGGDNLMNAIYTLSSNYAFTDVSYWSIGGVVNTDEKTPAISDLEAYQNITIELFTYNTIVPRSASNLTDINGYTRVSVPLNSGRYVVLVSHKEDNYYREINDTSVIEFEMLDPFVSISAEDIFYLENATAVFRCVEGVTGNVTLFVDGRNLTTQELERNYLEFNIPDLTGGVHTVEAYYLGDINYASQRAIYQFTVKPIPSYITVSCEGGNYGEPILINFTAGPEDITGEVVLTVETFYGKSFNVTGIKSFNDYVSNLTVGIHNVSVYYKGDNNYQVASNSTLFEILQIDLPADAYANPHEIPSNMNVTFSIEVPNSYDGKVRITVDGISRVYNVTGSTILIFDKLFLGDKFAQFEFFDDKNYKNLTLNDTFTIVKPSASAMGFGTVNADNMTRGANSPYDYQAAFLDYEGNLMVNINVMFVVNGKQYNTTTNKDGIAQLTSSKLPVGTYNITSINLLTGEETVRQLKIVKRITGNKDVTVDYASGKYFTVKVIGDNGKVAPAGEFVSMSIGKNHYVVKVDKKGYAKLKITFLPKTYKITTEYKGYKVKNKIVVKQTLKLSKKTITIAKSAKNIVLKATLKTSKGKAIAGKKISFKFNGKTYKAKTNKKGVAQVTVKKAVINKLKKGKSYKYTATYLKNTVKGTVKVKK